MSQTGESTRSRDSLTLIYSKRKDSLEQFRMRRKSAVYNCRSTPKHESVVILLSPAIGALGNPWFLLRRFGRLRYFATGCCEHQEMLSGVFGG